MSWSGAENRGLLLCYDIFMLFLSVNSIHTDDNKQIIAVTFFYHSSLNFYANHLFFPFNPSDPSLISIILSLKKKTHSPKFLAFILPWAHLAQNQVHKVE